MGEQTAGLTASTTRSEYEHEPRNVIRGSCQDALDVFERGVHGKNGPHAQAGGYTWSDPVIKVDWEVVGEARRMYTCLGDKCSGYYSSITAMQRACRVSLGKPSHAYRQILMVDVQATVTATITHQTWGLEWQTDCPEGQRWNAQIRSHETRHREDNQRIFQEWRRQFPPRPTLVGEGSTQEDLRKDIDEKVKQLRERELAELRRRMTEAADAFHRTPEGGRAVLDCSKCP